MKRYLTIVIASFAIPTAISIAQDHITPTGDPNISLKLEIERAIEKGVSYLESTQDPASGSWSDRKLPALTALPISAILGNPALEGTQDLPNSAEKGYQFLLTNVKSDGGIYGKGLATYNTALSIMALLQSGCPEHLPIIAKARRLLINQQQDFDRRGETDNLFDGGIGYGGSYAHSDLSNTHLALEALYYSKRMLADTDYQSELEFDLDWDAAIEFVSRCQNTASTIATLNNATTLRPEDEGGFIYFPNDTKSDIIPLEENGAKRIALRSYGSMSYAGLLAFIYADLAPDDSRLTAVNDWLAKNYTLVENPGMGAQGLYYYYHTMAKALAISRTEVLNAPNGEAIPWKSQLALKVMSHQQPNGSWVNTASNRWLEDDPTLVTAYALLTLQHVHRSL